MSRVITFSRSFPSYHPRKGEATCFVEKIWRCLNAPINYKLICDLNPKIDTDILWHFWTDINHSDKMEKGHTIRAGNRFKVGDWFSPRVWGNDINPKSGRSGPYHSKQIIIAPDIQVKKTWDFEVDGNGIMSIAKPGEQLKYLDEDVDEFIAKNDGLNHNDFIDWIVMPFYVETKDSGQMQIICWNENINY